MARSNAKDNGAATKSVNDDVIERAAEETHRMGLSERIAHWDRLQARQAWGDGNGVPLPLDIDPVALEAIPGRQLVRHPEVIVCRHDARHGALAITGNGAALICGGRKDGAFCTYTQPVSM